MQPHLPAGLGWARLAAATGLAAALALGAWPLAGPAPVSAATTTASIVDYGFNPTPITVSVGDTVHWTNTGKEAHTVTSEVGLFDSGSIAANGAYELIFNSPGTFYYYCKIHTQMRGKVVVASGFPAYGNGSQTASGAGYSAGYGPMGSGSYGPMGYGYSGYGSMGYGSGGYGPMGYGSMGYGYGGSGYGSNCGGCGGGYGYPMYGYFQNYRYGYPGYGCPTSSMYGGYGYGSGYGYPFRR